MRTDQLQMTTPCTCENSARRGRPGLTSRGPGAGNEPSLFPGWVGSHHSEADAGVVSGAQRQTLCPPKYSIHLLIHA